VFQCVAVCCRESEDVSGELVVRSMCCSVLKRVAVLCSEEVDLSGGLVVRYYVLQYVAVCCSDKSGCQCQARGS